MNTDSAEQDILLASHEKRYICRLSGPENLSTEIFVETGGGERHFLVWAGENVGLPPETPLPEVDIVIVTSYLKDEPDVFISGQLHKVKSLEVERHEYRFQINR